MTIPFTGSWSSPSDHAAYHRRIAMFERSRGNVDLAAKHEAIAAKYARKAGAL